jgi:dipeptidyl aminopeptidase/acylaminoacyl peptidase
VYRGGVPARYGLTDAARRGLASLARLLPGQNQTIETSRGPWLVREQDARLQGSRWHLFDPYMGTIRTLIDDPDVRQRIPAAALAAGIAFTYTASDGMPIHSLLSVPVGRDPAHVPLVALVHGGPWSHDMPGYSAQVQLLTNRGFAVFRPQFRGSTGYGRAYMFAAKGDFGDGRVQRDIEDGVRYLLAKGVGDAQRVGIVGASFGGYSTLQALSNGSKLFRVGVAVVPPSDFGWASRQMAKRNTIGDAQGIPFVQSLRLFGMDERDPAIARRLFVQSPAARTAAMNTPLLILAAGRDDRVAIRGLIDYAARLKAANKPVRMVIARNQPHAAEDPLARRASLFLIEDMLSRHLGGRPAAPPAPDLAQWMAANMAMH